MHKKYITINILLFILLSAVLIYAETSDEMKVKFRKGIEYTNEGKYDQAIQQFTQVITDNEGYAYAYMALGIVYINKKMDDEALEILNKAIELDPSNKRVHFILAKLYEKKENNQQALQLWEKYIELKPEKKFMKIAERHMKRLRNAK